MAYYSMILRTIIKELNKAYYGERERERDLMMLIPFVYGSSC